jgi:hypothetical protein
VFLIADRMGANLKSSCPVKVVENLLNVNNFERVGTAVPPVQVEPYD